MTTSDGAGVALTRVMGSSELDMLDPFLLLDEFRSDKPDDYIAGLPDHPHREEGPRSGPFVMNSRQEVMNAFQHFREGRF